MVDTWTKQRDGLENTIIIGVTRERAEWYAQKYNASTTAPEPQNESVS